MSVADSSVTVAKSQFPANGLFLVNAVPGNGSPVQGTLTKNELADLAKQIALVLEVAKEETKQDLQYRVNLLVQEAKAAGLYLTGKGSHFGEETTTAQLNSIEVLG